MGAYFYGQEGKRRGLLLRGTKGRGRREGTERGEEIPVKVSVSRINTV